MRMNRAHDENFSFSPASGSVCGQSQYCDLAIRWRVTPSRTFFGVRILRMALCIPNISIVEFTRPSKLCVLSISNTASPTSEAIAMSLEDRVVRKGSGSHSPCRIEKVSRSVLPASLVNKQQHLYNSLGSQASQVECQGASWPLG